MGWILGVAVAVALVAFAIPLCRRSIGLADEGYILLQSWDLLNGKVLYRDMDAFVTPGMWFVLAATFKLLGPSVIASRAPALLALLVMYAAGYRITQRLAGSASALFTLALLAVFTVWAFPAWTFAFYSPFAVTFALLGLERLLAWRASCRPRDLVLCGAMAGVAIVFKQNYGVFALVGLALGIAAVRVEQGRSGRDWMQSFAGDGLRLAIGLAAVGLPVLAWLLAVGALPAAWQSLVVHPFEFSGRHDIPYLSLGALWQADLMKSSQEMLTYAAQPIYRVPPIAIWLYEIDFIERLHVPLYWLPPVILILGATASYRPDERPVDAGLFSVTAVAGLIFLGVFPRADFNHLVNVYQPIVVLGVVLARHLYLRQPQPRSLVARLLIAGAVTVAAVYAAIAALWYVSLLEHLGSSVAVERGGVLAREEQARRIDYQVRTIQAETKPGEALLTVPDLSMLNFLADRPMPSAYYNLYEHHIAHDGGAAVVEGDRRNGGRLAVARFNDFFSDRVGVREYAPVLFDYLSTDFDLRYTVGREDFVHLERREAPRQLREGQSQSILAYCDISRGYQTVEEHLFFPALYHDPGTGREMEAATIETPCAVPVPAEGGVFSVRVGYRAPAAVQRNTTLTVEVLTIGEEQKTLMARKVFRVTGDDGNPERRPLDPELRIDLDPWRGSEVRLLLRTVRRGQVQVRPLEPRGFGTVWEDPRILLRDASGKAGS
jgi:hypothetical protein